jgi:hypothetical protein
MTMSVTSAVCLQLLPRWCTAANDEESDKQQRLSSLFLRSHTKLAREKQSVQQKGREFIVVPAAGRC